MPMHRLVALLQALGPEERLMVIQDKLTQAQRLALEQWMLKKRATAGCKANLKPQGLRKRRTLQSSQAKRLVEQDCCERGTSSGRHVVHLGRGFYAQAKLSVASQQVLKSLRESVAMLALPTSAGLDFEDAVADFVAKAGGNPASPSLLLFRSRITFSRSVRLSTPLKGDLAEALRDWRTMRTARGEVCTKRMEAQELEERWRRTHAALASLWEQQQIKPGRKRRQVPQEGTASVPSLARIANARVKQQEHAREEIDGLLAHQPAKGREPRPWPEAGSILGRAGDLRRVRAADRCRSPDTGACKRSESLAHGPRCFGADQMV